MKPTTAERKLNLTNGKPGILRCPRCNAFIGWKNEPDYRKLGIVKKDDGRYYKGEKQKGTNPNTGLCVDCDKRSGNL